MLATHRPDTKTTPSALRAVLGSRLALRVMDWRDSNIILGEQMNTCGWDSSRLLPSHKGVGILRPDGDTAAGADVLAMMVRTDYMPNDDWATLCERGGALRAAAGTLTGHAIGTVSVPVLDPATVAHVIGPSQPTDGMLKRQETLVHVDANADKPSGPSHDSQPAPPRKDRGSSQPHSHIIRRRAQSRYVL